jgi:hypothetical protein
MSLTSSFFAPVISVFGLPATIIIITGLSSSSFFLLLLVWNEFNQRREIRKNEIELNCRRDEKIDNILLEATTLEPVEKIQLYNQVVILTRDFPQIKKSRTEEMAKEICGQNATQEGKKISHLTVNEISKETLDNYEKDTILQLIKTNLTKVGKKVFNNIFKLNDN